MVDLYDLGTYFNDHVLAAMGVLAAMAVLGIYLLETYMPIEEEKPKLLFNLDESIK